MVRCTRLPPTSGRYNARGRHPFQRVCGNEWRPREVTTMPVATGSLGGRWVRHAARSMASRSTMTMRLAPVAPGALALIVMESNIARITNRLSSADNRSHDL